MEKDLPSEDARDLDLGSIRTSWGKIFVNSKNPDDGQNKWVEPLNDFDLDNLSFWEIQFLEDEERVRFVPKETNYVIEGKNQPVSNPISIVIDFTFENVKILLQDLGKVYEVEDKWSNLSGEYTDAFTNLWKRLLDKIREATGDKKYSISNRLDELWSKTEPAKYSFITPIIKQDLTNLLDLLDGIGYEYSKITEKTPETPEQPIKEPIINYWIKYDTEKKEQIGSVSSDIWGLHSAKIRIGDFSTPQEYKKKWEIYANTSDDFTKLPKNQKRFLTRVAWIDGQDYYFDLIDRPEPKFAIGDKVVRLGGKQPMVVVKQIYDDNKKMWDYDLKFIENDSPVSAFEDQLEEYIEETPEVPEKIIQKGEFFERRTNVWLATEDSVQGRGYQYIVMESFRYFEASIYQFGLVFNETNQARRKFGELKCGFSYDYKRGFKFYCEKGALIISETLITNLGIAEMVAQRIILFLATFDLELSDEFKAIWEKIEDGVERGIIRADWRTTKTDCEADPTKIVSSQVKSFYDLNKNRIEKLKPEFSCKIIQALVSLSEYESCGVPSSESLPKPKNDLLSDIKNFTL